MGERPILAAKQRAIRLVNASTGFVCWRNDWRAHSPVPIGGATCLWAKTSLIVYCNTTGLLSSSSVWEITPGLRATDEIPDRDNLQPPGIIASRRRMAATKTWSSRCRKAFHRVAVSPLVPGDPISTKVPSRIGSTGPPPIVLTAAAPLYRLAVGPMSVTAIVKPLLRLGYAAMGLVTARVPPKLCSAPCLI